MHFIFQSAPDICRNLQKLESGLQTGQIQLVNLGIRVFNNRDEVKTQQERQREEAKTKSCNQAYQLLASALKETQDFPRQKGKTLLETVSSVGNLGIGPNNVPTPETLQGHAHCVN